MNTQELHDTFQMELIRRGMPMEYASGAAAELADHHRDVAEELRATGLDDVAAETEAAHRLGDRQLLLKKSIREFQRRHWCGRWPLLTFLLGTPLVLIATWIATGTVLWAIGRTSPTPGVTSDADGIISRGELIGFWGLWFVWTVALPTLVAFASSRLAIRCHLGWRWALAGCLSVAALAGALRFTIDFDRALCMITIPSGWFSASAWTQWFGGFSDGSASVSPWQPAQWLLPLVACAVVIIQAKHRETASLQAGNC